MPNNEYKAKMIDWSIYHGNKGLRKKITKRMDYLKV
jgi:hypothetical protein